jgi:type IV/VI secretion system ImpK/VasF family protein
MMRSSSRYIVRAEFSQPFSRFMVNTAIALEERFFDAQQLFDYLTAGIHEVTVECQQKQFDAAAVQAALLAICAWADERIMNAEWEGVSEVWPDTLLQKKFFNTNLGGELFYDKLKTLFSDTLVAHDVFALCLAQGFKGKYVLNLDLDEYEQKKKEVINNSLIYTGLSLPSTETFASLNDYSQQEVGSASESKIIQPVAISLACLIGLALFLYFLVSNDVSNLLKSMK